MEVNVGLQLLGPRFKHEIFAGECTQEHFRVSETRHCIDGHLPLE